MHRVLTYKGNNMTHEIEKREFLSYIEAQLIPSLRDAGMHETAEDMETLLDIAFFYYESLSAQLIKTAKGDI